MNTEKARKDFEDWMGDGGLSPRAIERNSKGDYILMQTAHAWAVWRAAATQSASNSAEFDGIKKAAPVALPEPEAYLYVNGDRRAVNLAWISDTGLQNDTVRQSLYTEQQVRELLASDLGVEPQQQADALDTERLDWLIEQGCSHGVVYELDKSFWMVWLDGHDAHKDEHQIGRYHTAREAIDAAIAAAKGE